MELSQPGAESSSFFCLEYLPFASSPPSHGPGFPGTSRRNQFGDALPQVERTAPKLGGLVGVLKGGLTSGGGRTFRGYRAEHGQDGWQGRGERGCGQRAAELRQEDGCGGAAGWGGGVHS